MSALLENLLVRAGVPAVSPEQVAQRSADWHALRAGRFTGSKFADLMARSKKDGKPLKARENLIWRVVVERMTGRAADSIDGYALAWGRECEDYGLAAVEIETGETIERAGFLIHPKLTYAGISPDGLIGTDGGLELKCPKDSEVHLIRFLDGMPEEYYAQVQGAMWVTGRKWWLFASYDPRMCESHRLYLQKVERDDAFIARLEADVIAAEAEVVAKLAALRAGVAS